MYLVGGFTVGVLFVLIFFIFTPVFAQLTLDQIQKEYYEINGSYEQTIIDDTGFGIHVYEGICKGYQVVTDYPDRTEFLGFGGMADDYTYITLKNEVRSTTSTSTSTFIAN